MIEIFQVDAFTSEPFTGNPAGVCIIDDIHNDGLLQKIAMEMAVSKTAFISLNDFNLRWFTPTKEVSLCGHATLATTWLLYQKGILNECENITFNTLSGKLSVTVRGSVVEMNFPLITVTERTQFDIQRIDLLGIPKSDIVFYGMAGEKDFIEIASETTLRDMAPDFSGLARCSGRGVIVTTSTGDARYDFVSRYFAPWVGVNEDPVTGSAHCALADYWGRKQKKRTLAGYQASRRGGVVNMALSADDKVKISGKARLTIEGKMYL